MKGDILRSQILSEKIIPNMNEQYRKQFPIPEGHRSLGLFTANCDDVCYIGMEKQARARIFRLSMLRHCMQARPMQASN